MAARACVQFEPDLIIVSAGFDAAEGDPIGGCRLTSECFSHMTALLKAVAPLALVLEVRLLEEGLGRLGARMAHAHMHTLGVVSTHRHIPTKPLQTGDL